MNARKDATPTSSGIEFTAVEADEITPEEYEELPELTEEMMKRATLRKGEQDIYSFPKELITLPLPTAIFERWVATGPGWYERMAKKLHDV